MAVPGTTSTLVQPVAAPPVAALEVLAARLREAGLLLVALRADGSEAYHDAKADPFLLEFVLPQILEAAPSWFGTTAVAKPSGVTEWPGLRGAVAASFTQIERRQVAAVLVIAAKDRDSAGGADLRGTCDLLPLDAAGIAGQAGSLHGHDASAVLGYARLAQATFHDQLSLGGLQQELDSLSGQLANTYEELSLVYQISSGMKINRTTGEFFRKACQDVLEVTGVRGLGVTLCGEGACRQDPVLYGPLQLPPTVLTRLGEELTALMRERKSLLMVNDLRINSRFRWLDPHVRQLIAVPLQRQEQVLGCLFALNKEDGEFDSVDGKLLNSIANQSAIYLENANLFGDVRELMMGVLHSLTSAVDAKDAYTCGHSERVALLSRRLAEEAGLPAQKVDRIYMAGLLHDVGKIGVPEVVLQKAGRLTPDEFEQIKKHPVVGARILQDIKQLADVIPGVLHHHERYDGKGYPAGLAGQDVPLMGRVICVADSFDAMTSNRTYRRALPLEVALIEVRRCAGTHFDPMLAEAFLRIQPEEFRTVLRDHHAQARRRLDAA